MQSKKKRYKRTGVWTYLNKKEMEATKRAANIAGITPYKAARRLLIAWTVQVLAGDKIDREADY